MVGNSTFLGATATSIDSTTSFSLMDDVFGVTGTGLTNYYSFNGSLTTPPCTEGLNWRIMATPLELSRAQLAVFRKALAFRQLGVGQGADNRDTQPLNARTVLVSFDPTVSAAPKAVASVVALVVMAAAALAF